MPWLTNNLKKTVTFFPYCYLTIEIFKKRTMKNRISSVLLLFICIIGSSLQSCEKEESPLPVTISEEKGTEYAAAMRYLWTDHATWTRDVILGILDQSPDAGDALTRLLQNQVDIGNAIKPYYGEEAGNTLTALLKEHIVVAGDLLVAARDGNNDAFNDANTKWYQNGEDIAVFLNTSNPTNWELEHMKSHMTHHLDLTLAEAVAHLEGRHADEVKAYDDVYEQLMHMADLLSDGIIKQFPEKF